MNYYPIISKTGIPSEFTSILPKFGSEKVVIKWGQSTHCMLLYF